MLAYDPGHNHIGVWAVNIWRVYAANPACVSERVGPNVTKMCRVHCFASIHAHGSLQVLAIDMDLAILWN